MNAKVWGEMAKNLGKYFGKYGLSFLKEIAAFTGSNLAGAFGSVFKTIQASWIEMTKFHEESISFARDLGMSAKQAQGYAKALTENTKELAIKYGVTSEVIIKVQKGISEATNKQIFLNKKQEEGFLRLSKLAGDASINKFAEEMMNGMGAQVDAVEGAIAKAYATAAKNGLSAKKTTELIGNNLIMANKLSFRNGVDGITKMAMEAQKVSLSLQSVESVAKTFMDFEGAIEHSAQLQMLGGAAGAFGGNPLDMMYEANYDPEALQERMIKMLSGYAEFDANTGISKVNGFNMDMLRNIAKAMGMDEVEAVKVAKKNAELFYKQNNFGRAFRGFTEEQQNAIMNKSYVRDGKLYATDAKGKEYDISHGINPETDLFKELTQFAGKSDREIMEEQARSLISIDDMLKSIWSAIHAVIGEKFIDYYPKIQKFIQDNGPKIVEKVEEFAKHIPEILDKIEKKLTKWWPDIKKAISNAITFFANALENWEETKKTLRKIASVFGVGVASAGANKISKIAKGGASTTAAGAAGAGAAGAGGGAGAAGAGGGAGAAGAGAAGAANASGGAGATGAGGGASNTVKRGKHTWTKGSDGKWTRDDGRTPQNAKEIKDLNRQLGNKPKPSATTTGSNGGGATGAGGTTPSAGATGKSGALRNIAKKAKIGRTGAIAAAMTALEGYWALGDYDTAEEEIIKSDLSDEDKKTLLAEAKKRRNEALGGAGTGPVVGAAAVAALNFFTGGAGFWGSTIAYGAGDWLGRQAGEWAGGLLPTDVDDEELAELKKKHANPKESYAKGGPVSGAFGEPQLAIVHGKESVLTPKMQEFLFPAVQGRLPENDFTYKPGREENSKVGDSTVKVTPITMTVNGRIDVAGQNVDVDELMRKNPQFAYNLKEIISETISASYNGGRKMIDPARKSGLLTQTTIYGH